MDDKTLNNLKNLWEKFDDHETNNEKKPKKDENNSYNSINIIKRYERNFKWVPPNFAKLPNPDYDSKITTKYFSMAYNEEEIRNNSSTNVN